MKWTSRSTTDILMTGVLNATLSSALGHHGTEEHMEKPCFLLRKHQRSKAGFNHCLSFRFTDGQIHEYEIHGHAYRRHCRGNSWRAISRLHIGGCCAKPRNMSYSNFETSGFSRFILAFLSKFELGLWAVNIKSRRLYSANDLHISKQHLKESSKKDKSSQRHWLRKMVSLRNEASKHWSSGFILVESSFLNQHQRNVLLPLRNSYELQICAKLLGWKI